MVINMQIQWPLVIFTVLAGAGAWLLVFLCINEFTGKLRDEKVRFRTLVTVIVLVVLGGCASVLHLSHPDRMMGALSHPTSGIFTEALMVGLVSLASIVFLVAARRKVSSTALKGIAAVSGVCGLILSYATGAGYMMDAQLTWDTPLMPLGYMATAATAGAALYLIFVSTGNRESPSGMDSAAVGVPPRTKAVRFTSFCTLVAGVAAAVIALAYAVSSNTLSIASASPVLAASVVGALAAAGFGYAAGRCGRVLPLAVVALVCALVAMVAFRCFMWLVGVGLFNFFGGDLFATI